MNRKKFEIWRGWKEAEHEREKQKLIDDLANRGMAQSGIRGMEESNLRERYNAEIEMEHAVMEEDEEEKKEERKERKNQIRTNRIIAVSSIVAALSAMGSVIVALPIFSTQINNIQVKVDTLQASIKGLYAAYTLETFCKELGGSFQHTANGTVVLLHLKKVPIQNSLNVWEGAVSVSPTYFHVSGNIVSVETNMTNITPDNISELCANDFKYSVTYIPQD